MTRAIRTNTVFVSVLMLLGIVVTNSPTAAQAAGKSCDGADVTTQILTTSDGVNIAAFVQGTGTTAIVLVHQVNDDHCGWSSEAKSLAAKATVISIDLRGYGASGKAKGKLALAYPNDIAAAVTFARNNNAKRVVLMGASMGASAVVVAASRITPTVDAAIAVSAPGVYKGQDAIGAAPAVKAPIRYVAAKDDGSAAATATKLDAKSTASTDADALIFNAGGHGWRLVRPGSEAETAVLAFLEPILTA
jgi:pimeloyl-ACP methyl ester carboxylesterase